MGPSETVHLVLGFGIKRPGPSGPESSGQQGCRPAFLDCSACPGAPSAGSHLSHSLGVHTVGMSQWWARAPQPSLPQSCRPFSLLSLRPHVFLCPASSVGLRSLRTFASLQIGRGGRHRLRTRNLEPCKGLEPWMEHLSHHQT